MSGRKLLILVSILAVLILVLAACGASSANTGSGNTLNVTVTGTEYKFDPNTITASAGQQVHVTFKDAGTLEHTFVIKQVNFKLDAQPGQTVSGTFTAPSAGTYQFACDIPGHAEAGMVGQLIVK